MQQTLSITVCGRVQGVFYRQSTKQQAQLLGIKGTVRNKPDGSVLIIATGTKDQLEVLLAWCRQGSPRAQVTGVEWEELELQLFNGFSVER